VTEISGHESIILQPTIAESLRKRLMPVEGAIPQLAGIDMYGNSVPAGTVGGDLFEYINFQQRYNINGRIARALKLAKVYVDAFPAREICNALLDDAVKRDEHLQQSGEADVVDDKTEFIIKRR
jgi:hypothetical protein